MRALVTGCAGFIGSHLCERLLADGWTIFGVDNFDPFYDPAIKQRNLRGFVDNPRVTFAPLDLVDDEALRAWWAGIGPVDVVVHLAARAGVRPSIQQPLACERANIQATLSLLELAARQNPVPRFVFASSSSVYGNNPQVPFSEDDPVDHPISPYAATKKAGELLCYTYHHLYGMPMTALRFFTVYGPRQRPDLAIHKFIARILRGEPIPMFGDGSMSRDYTFIDDILDGVVAAMERREGYEIINLGSKNPIRLDEMIATIEAQVGMAAKIERLPLQAGDVDRTFADVTKAARLLHYAPQTPFPDGVAREVAWCREIYR